MRNKNASQSEGVNEIGRRVKTVQLQACDLAQGQAINVWLQGRARARIPFKTSGAAAVVQREGAGAGKHQIEEDEAERDRRIAAIVDREEVARHVRHEIGDRHFAGQKEGYGPREQAERQQDAAGEFEDAAVMVSPERAW